MAHENQNPNSGVAKRAEPSQKSATAAREEEILAFWQKNDIIKKSFDKEPIKGEFVFYEGPPTANGKPGIHHLESRAFKDAIPRFRTMQGFHVRRKAGWDTHGLPVEIMVEKEIGSKSKKDIEAFGIAEFNKKCKESVLRFIDEWKSFTDRIGFWVDHDSTYFTFDNDYIESVWNILKVSNEKKLLYKDYKVVPWCPRCGTALSSHEVAQGYDLAKDPTVYVKFKVKNPEKIGLSGDVFILAWTTTPWTLPGNVALAVGENIEYVAARALEDANIQPAGTGTYSVHDDDSIYIVAKTLYGNLKLNLPKKEFRGKDLVGLEYEPLYPFLKDSAPAKEQAKFDKAYKVYPADFVSTEDGTGIVHTAVMYGTDDFELGTRIGLPKYHLVGEDGKMTADTKQFAGMFVKDADKPIIEDLKNRGLLFKDEIVEHMYPFCWRCKTPLLYYADDSWYIRMSEVRGTLIAENETINWQPEHIREGRFGEWLKDLKDWAISRSRYWGTPLPFWECEKCKSYMVIGSVAELKEKSEQPVPENLDLHRPYIDAFTFKCDCGGEMKRVPDVLDVWFDSGAMPFAQDHYPFENKAWVDGAGYPADYISEAIDQTRGWFYTLHAVGAGIMGRGKAFKNVICLGHILDAKGKKMSKSLGNIVEPFSMIDKYGVDALRYFMFTVNAPGDNKNFDERIVDEIVKKNLGRLNNVLAFYKLYDDPVKPDGHGAGGTPRDWKSDDVLDQWILSRLEQLVAEATDGFEKYQLDSATRPIAGFIDDLSVWYLRRSRDRFKTDGPDKQHALATLRYVLHKLSRVIAPTMPFYAEYLFQAVREDEDEESVHLAMWPEAGKEAQLQLKLVQAMAQARKIVSLALEARDKANIKVRQPLPMLRLPPGGLVDFPELGELLTIISEELNVKATEIVKGLAPDTVELDTTITPELKEEGFVRDFLRAVQGERKNAGLNPQDRITLKIDAPKEVQLIMDKHQDEIANALRATVVSFTKVSSQKQSIGEYSIGIEVTKE
ncbi:MAG TPA: isoleucine--tRNA ligase [Candidatus Paceibacterota bacterium]|nr:isoleucine--tRNA ligase [Candidatus Paceibacterota bacterium]